jgi:hypothetical protein
VLDYEPDEKAFCLDKAPFVIEAGFFNLFAFTISFTTSA